VARVPRPQQRAGPVVHPRCQGDRRAPERIRDRAARPRSPGERGDNARRPGAHALRARARARLGQLARVYNHLRQTAAPSRDKLSRLVPATDLLELGLRLMDTCESGSDRPAYVAIRYRDGLMIALLIACPIRIKNLANLVIGQHLVFDGDAYLVKLSATETKTGRPYVAAVPPELTPYIDRWLEIHRLRLQTFARGQAQVGGHLWINRYGRPMGSGAIRQQIEERTRQAFGKHVWPHLFRDCAVTELVDCAPEEIGIALDLLGHANLQTTKRHYIQAVGMRAHARVQEVISARRRAATSRDTTGTIRA
jgi:integrase